MTGRTGRSRALERSLVASAPAPGPVPDPASSRAAHHAVDLSTYFDRVAVINLDRRADRRERFERHIDAIDWPFRAPERVRAVDGLRCTSPEWWRAGRGAWGCFRSILSVIEAAMMDEVERVLVLEDDVCFVSDVRERASQYLGAVPDDWHQLYLGGEHLHPRRRPTPVNAEVVRPFNVNRSHAFALHRRYLGPLYRHLTDYAQHKAKPRHHVDHRMGALHRAGHFNIYAPTRWLAGQCEGYSDIQETTVLARFWQQPQSSGARGRPSGPG